MHQKSTWMQSKSLFVFGLLAVMAISVAASAQTNDWYSVNYFNTGATSSSGASASGNVYIINTGYQGVGPSGNLCAMIYVYDPKQEPKECCGCVVTPDQLLTLSIASLTSNPANHVFTTSGAFKLVSSSLNDTTPSATDPFQPGCDPSGGGTPALPTGGTPVAPIQELRAWDTHTASNGTITEAEFEPSDLAVPGTELTKLQADCAKVLNGSGTGICSCPAALP
jgi:hypothetical protein